MVKKSHTNCEREATNSNMQNINEDTFPSYMEYPSEILQRTTNFEGDGMWQFNLINKFDGPTTY